MSLCAFAEGSVLANTPELEIRLFYEPPGPDLFWNLEFIHFIAVKFQYFAAKLTVKMMVSCSIRVEARAVAEKGNSGRNSRGIPGWPDKLDLAFPKRRCLVFLFRYFPLPALLFFFKLPERVGQPPAVFFHLAFKLIELRGMSGIPGQVNLFGGIFFKAV